MSRLSVLSISFPFGSVRLDCVGGAEQVVAHIDRALFAHGHRSIVLAVEGSASCGELVGIPKPTGGIGAAEWARAHDFLRRAIPHLLKTHRIDILHMHGVDFANYLPPPGVPVLATLHMPLNFYPPDAIDPKRPRTWVNTVSRAQQKLIANRSTREVGAIENGVPLSPPNPRWRRRLYALAMGRICPEKGFHLALDAAKLAGVPMWLAGQVFPYAEHMQYFEREILPRLDRSRRWIGPVSGVRKRHLLASAQCLLVPSLVPETASLSAREALAAGTPVVAFPNGALADVVDHGSTGFLVSSVDEMASAILQADEINPLTCREVARLRFKVSRMTNAYLELYERLLKVA
jgi:glycosyltransferase involved in cell wall biosynthesis